MSEAIGQESSRVEQKKRTDTLRKRFRIYMEGSHTSYFRAELDGFAGKWKFFLDDGTSQSAIDRHCPLLEGLVPIAYEKKKRLRRIDGTIATDAITHFVKIRLRKKDFGPIEIELAIMDLDTGGIVLGLDFNVRFRAIVDFSDMSIEIQYDRLTTEGIEVKGRRSTLVDGNGLEKGDPVFNALKLAEDPDEEEEEVEESELRSLVPSEFHGSLDLFKRASYESLPENREFDHAVELKSPELLRKARVYPLSHAQDQWLKDWIDKNKRIGHIEESKHWFGSPVFLVPKKNGEFRMVTDFRELNKQTVKDIYPLPRISTLLERIRTATIFSKFDMPTSYQLLRMRPGDEKWTTILTRYGAFQSKVMREGMSNAGASFQRFMNVTFKDLIDDGVIVYIDDILVYSKTRRNISLPSTRFSIDYDGQNFT